MKTAILSLLSFCVLVRADFDPARWQFRRTLVVEQPGQVCVLKLDRTVYAGAETGLADLRVVRNNQEVPYIIATLTGSAEEAELRPEILDRSVAPGAGLQLTLDAGRAAKHNRLRITTGQTNFRIKVRIETSDDGRSWAIARADGYVFDFSQGDRNVSVLMVEYPVSTRRYVRATFFGWQRTDAVRDAWLTRYQARPPIWQTLATAAPARSEDAGTSILVLDLGVARLPHARLRVETDAAPFHRACEIESSDDRKDWRYVARGVLYRFPDEEPSSIEFPEQHDRYVRLRIFNGDDRPVAIRDVIFEAVERRVKFLPDAAGEYALYYGNPKAKAPAYDLGTILAARAPVPEIVLTAAAEQSNPAYRPPPPPVKPWSERYPGLLYGTLAAAILGMGYLTVRLLMSVKRAG